MVGTVVFWVVVGVYVAGVLGPRLFWVMAGRRCPHCESGRLWFAGLADNPWRRLRSWWRCESCHAEIRETAWGRWESQTDPEAIEADLAA